MADNTTFIDPLMAGQNQTMYTPQQMNVQQPSIAQTSLQQDLVKNMAAAQEAQGQTQQGIGIGSQPATKSFQERGIKIGKRIIAQDELETAINTQKRAIDSFVKSAGYTDQLSSNIATEHLNDRLNKLRVDLITKGLEFQKKLEQAKASNAERAMAAKNWGSIAGMAVGAYFGGPAGAMVGSQLGQGALGGGGAQEYQAPQTQQQM